MFTMAIMATADARPRRRADAERNIARIVAAARRALSADPEARVDDIAQAAGVGRMTLYGHFPSRADLVEAAVVDALRAGEQTLSAIDLTGDAMAAVVRLLESSWSLAAESSALLGAAEGALPAARILELHAEPASRVEELLRRGQDQGVFRADLPISWLISVIHQILHGAAGEIRAGRLAPDDAGRVIIATVLPILAVPPVDGGCAAPGR